MSNDKTKTIITIDKESKKLLNEMALIENRTVNNMMVTILKKFIEENKDKYTEIIKSI